MRARVGLVVAVAIAVLAVALPSFGCASDGTECSDGAFAGRWSGPAAYTGTSSAAPAGLAGSASLAITTTEPMCRASDGSVVEDDLTLTLGPRCVLPARRTSTHTVQHCEPCGRNRCCTPVFVDGTAETSASPCELPLGDDGTSTMDMVVSQGIAHVTAKGAFDVTLSGTLVTWSGASGAIGASGASGAASDPSAFVTVHFESASPAGG